MPSFFSVVVIHPAPITYNSTSSNIVERLIVHIYSLQRPSLTIITMYINKGTLALWCATVGSVAAFSIPGKKKIENAKNNPIFVFFGPTHTLFLILILDSLQ
jgi:hypothetical protein